MTLLISVLLLFQSGVRGDLLALRQYLGRDYRSIIQRLDADNQILLRNTEPLAPAQAAEMRARMKAPDRFAAGNPILSVALDNVGQGMVTLLFDDDFITERVNFVFCPAQAELPERLMAIQILMDDSQALQPAVTLLQSVYQLPQPFVPGAGYKLALPYPLRSNLPVTLWNLDTVEAMYQPIPGQKLITGQLWLSDKNTAATCSAVPKLPGAP